MTRQTGPGFKQNERQKLRPGAERRWDSALGSNIFSNVPFVLVAGKWIGNLAQPELMWKGMALATTFAGNLTLLGSVANIIVAESARATAKSASGITPSSASRSRS